MKKNAAKILILAVSIGALVVFFNIDVTTRQGVDYKVRAIHIPLYLKTLDFIDRHYNYKQLVRNITAGAKDRQEGILRIFRWVNSNIKRNPPELPVIDDHPFNIIIRGYGVEDQFEDVFTILCTYAGADAFYEEFHNSLGGKYIVSFVNIRGRWYPFSTYHNAYVPKGDTLVSMDDIMQNPGLLSPLLSRIPHFDAEIFLAEVRKMKFEANSMRTKGQSPFGRVAYYLSNIGRSGHSYKKK